MKGNNPTVDELNGKLGISKDQLMLVLEEMKKEQLIGIRLDGSLFLN